MIEESQKYIKFYLRRSKMLAFLDELERNDDKVAVSLYLPPGLDEPAARALFNEAGGVLGEKELVKQAVMSPVGAAFFRGTTRVCLVLPPFPLLEKAIFSGYDTGPLRSLLSPDRLVGLVLVHLGSYAVGICRGEVLLDSKVGTGLVHGRHKKGGSSQARFQRRRQNQAAEFLDRVCRHAEEKLGPYASDLAYLAYGGPGQTLLKLQQRCPLLSSLADRALPALNVQELRQSVLETTVGRVWSSVIFEWPVEPPA